MRVVYTVLAVFLVLGSFVSAGPICGEIDENPETGAKTWNAVKSWFHPMCTYITQKLPQKTPAVLVDDAKDKVDDVRLWAQENEMVQGLKSALTPVKTWIKDTGNTLKDQTFNEMYENVKISMKSLDDRIGNWLKTNNAVDDSVNQ